MSTFSEEQIAAALTKAPSGVQEVIEDGVVAAHVVRTAQTQGLHIDHIGIAAEYATYMLLGLVSPTQFVSELKTAGVPELAANTILQDLNEKVFKPLYVKVRAASAPESEERPVRSVEQPPVTSSVVPLPTPPSPPPPIVVQSPAPIPSVPPMRTMAEDVKEKKEGFVPATFTPPVSTPPPVPLPTPPAAPPPATQASNATQVHEDLKKYGIDPYREPLE